MSLQPDKPIETKAAASEAELEFTMQDTPVLAFALFDGDPSLLLTLGSLLLCCAARRRALAT